MKLKYIQIGTGETLSHGFLAIEDVNISFFHSFILSLSLMHYIYLIMY